jgi:hypothetical protein
MNGMEQAEKAGDLESLRWCARMLKWLWDQGEVNSYDTCCYTEKLFNRAWNYVLEKDPPPASIAAIVAGREEGPMGKAAERARDTLAAFFEESLAKRDLPAALRAVENLRGTVMALTGEEAE